ncbi:MAG: hypothetical protein IPI11_16315 [Haliscomenobacter sp.]|nr:hypothetical protein [Haliscomenobacter sp.]
MTPDNSFPAGVTFAWEQMDKGKAAAPPDCTENDGPLFRSRKHSESPTRYFPEIGATLNNFTPIWEVLPCSGRTLNFRLTVRGDSVGYCTEMYDISFKVDGNAGPFRVTAPSDQQIWPSDSELEVRWEVGKTNKKSPRLDLPNFDLPLFRVVNSQHVNILLSTDRGSSFTYKLTEKPVPNNGSAKVKLPAVETTNARIKVEAADNIFFAVSDPFAISGDANLVECASLTALYNATNGPKWKNKQGWLADCKPCTWYGVQCEDGQVVGLNLFDNGLDGTIPPEIGNLAQLGSLNLGLNQLKGSIPAKIGSLTNLHYLNLGANQLSGAIPGEIGNLTNLTHLNLHQNKITGPIPASIGKLTQLTNLLLDNNQLQGSIPKEIGNLRAINTLNLQDNKLSGCFPASLIALCGKAINLSNNPNLPSAGSATAWTAFCSSGGVVGADSNGDGICETTPNCTHPDYKALVALFNATNGPKWNNKAGWLKDWDPCNGWYGVTCKDGRVVRLSLGSNHLVGSIPMEIGNLERLVSLDLGDNQLKGGMPASIGNLRALNVLRLGRNQLEGAIPDGIGNLKALTDLHLDENRFAGPIPVSIGGLTNLNQLHLQENQLSGEIPDAIGNLSRLQGLFLNDNRLNGALPSSLGELSSLRYLFLGNNQLSGAIPVAIGNLTNLFSLDLKNNGLGGSIPEFLGNLASLTYLHLGSNQFSGAIPRNIGRLNNLSRLILSHNTLNGLIPIELGGMRKLQELLLNNNRLSGCIPVSFTSLCGKEVDLSNNPNLPGGGSPEAWNAFCSSGGVVGADTNGDGICETSTVHPDYAALKALYLATNGDNWTNNTGWLKHDDPCSGGLG